MGVEGPLISAIVIPTHDLAVAETYKIFRRLRNGLVPLVDGESHGDPPGRSDIILTYYARAAARALRTA